MLSSRRDFIKGLGMGIGGLGVFGLTSREAVAGLKRKLEQIQHRPAAEVAMDEDFWFHVQQAFNTDRSIINLNNGGVHPSPKVVVDAMKKYLDFANGAPVLNEWRYLRPRKELIRKKIADSFGCSPEEIALVRNVTEALQNALMGIKLEAGDEVLTTTHDYPSMKNALYQREKREGVVVKTFSFDYPPKSMKYLADLFMENTTSRTKLILVCHVTNLTGQIFPVRDICRRARQKGIDVVIDGAHAYGHFAFKQRDLDCDVYGANLHKWMMAPIGNGFLYIKKERIKDLWPLFPAPDPQSEDIRKFEHLGTQPEYLKLAVGDALAFHEGIGAERKEERLRYLRNYWAKELQKMRGVKILTSFDREMSCGIASFTIEGMDMGRLAQVLFRDHEIYVISVQIPGSGGGDPVRALRVSPSVYTTLRELDIFNETVKKYIQQGLPVQ